MTGSAIQHTGRTNYNQVYRKVIKLPWHKWFAWYPVRVHGKYTWLKIVYRRSIHSYADLDDWQRYEYGTLFDVIAE
jgi:hypothetical protein